MRKQFMPYKNITSQISNYNRITTLFKKIDAKNTEYER